MQRHRNLLPPRRKRPFFAIKRNGDACRSGGAAHGLTEERAALIAKRGAIVFVQRTAALPAGINVQHQRPGRGLRGALHERLARQDCSGADEHGQAIKPWRFEHALAFGVFGRHGLGCRLDRTGGGRFGRSRPQAGPIIIPAPGGEAHIIGLWRFRAGRRRDQQRLAEREGHRLVAAHARGAGVIVEDRAHDRVAEAAVLVRQRIEIRHQAIAFLDEAAADREVIGAIDPRLDTRRAGRAMVAEDRGERPDLEPARQQIGARAARKAADVGGAIGKARQAKIDDLLHRQLQVIPGRAVVAGPGDGIALPPGIAGARHHEGALIGA
ncbi:hypothetical protein D9M73_111510 [compost metagenome]